MYFNMDNYQQPRDKFPSEKARQKYYRDLEFKKINAEKNLTKDLVQAYSNLKTQEIKAPEQDESEIILDRVQREQRVRDNMLQLLGNNQQKTSAVLQKFKKPLYKDFLTYYPAIFEEIKKVNIKLLRTEEIIKSIEKVITKSKNDAEGREKNSAVVETLQAVLKAIEEGNLSSKFNNVTLEKLLKIMDMATRGMLDENNIDIDTINDIMGRQPTGDPSAPAIMTPSAIVELQSYLKTITPMTIDDIAQANEDEETKRDEQDAENKTAQDTYTKLVNGTPDPVDMNQADTESTRYINEFVAYYDTMATNQQIEYANDVFTSILLALKSYNDSIWGGDSVVACEYIKTELCDLMPDNMTLQRMEGEIIAGNKTVSVYYFLSMLSEKFKQQFTNKLGTDLIEFFTQINVYSSFANVADDATELGKPEYAKLNALLVDLEAQGISIQKFIGLFLAEVADIETGNPRGHPTSDNFDNVLDLVNVDIRGKTRKYYKDALLKYAEPLRDLFNTIDTSLTGKPNIKGDIERQARGRTVKPLDIPGFDAIIPVPMPSRRPIDDGLIPGEINEFERNFLINVTVGLRTTLLKTSVADYETLVIKAIEAPKTITDIHRRHLNVLLDGLGLKNAFDAMGYMEKARGDYIITLAGGKIGSTKVEGVGMVVTTDKNKRKATIPATSDLGKFFTKLKDFEATPEGQTYLQMLADSYD
jgi:hypothetical protein